MGLMDVIDLQETPLDTNTKKERLVKTIEETFNIEYKSRKDKSTEVKRPEQTVKTIFFTKVSNFVNNPQYSGNQNKQKETTFREKSGRKHIIENSNEKVIENKNYEENLGKNTRVHTGESQKNYAENIERDNTGVKQKENDNRTNLKEQVLTKIRNSNTQEINAKK